VEFADIRQRLGQDFGFDLGGYVGEVGGHGNVLSMR
jgi:hypothetical protein